MKNILVFVLLIQQSFMPLAQTTDLKNYNNIQIIEINKKDIKKIYYSFESKVSGEMINVVLTLPLNQYKNNYFIGTNLDKKIIGSDLKYTFEITLPKGKIIINNGVVSVFNASEFAQFSLLDFQKSNLLNEKFTKLINEIAYDSDIVEFSNIINNTTMEKGVGSCLFALGALAAANLALAGALAITYTSAGAASMAIGAATSAVLAAAGNVASSCSSSQPPTQQE